MSAWRSLPPLGTDTLIDDPPARLDPADRGALDEQDDRAAVVIAMIGVTPMTIRTSLALAALDEVPEDLLLCARTLGASRLYTLLHVQIRSALPGILTGMRICMAGAWTSIVAAELIAATSGLGYLIGQAGDYLNIALVFSGLICIALIALTLDACIRGLLLLTDPSRRT